MDAFGSYRKFGRFVACRNWTLSDAVSSLLSAGMF